MSFPRPRNPYAVSSRCCRDGVSPDISDYGSPPSPERQLRDLLMPRLLILLTLPKEVRDFYAARLAKRFPDLHIDVVDHFSKAAPFMPSADILLTFGPMLKDEALHNADKLKWIQALGTGVDGVIDQPSLRPD